MIVDYNRKYTVQASHFNDGSTYDTYKEACEKQDFNLLHSVLRQQHGHNFKVEVCVSADPTRTGFVVDDDALTNIVESWNNTNITLHPDFDTYLRNGTRVTLELMCVVLRRKIEALVGGNGVVTSVTIHETDSIYARL